MPRKYDGQGRVGPISSEKDGNIQDCQEKLYQKKAK